MDISGLTTVAADNKTSAAADALTSSAGKLSSASSDDELLDTVKDFESYFLEQIIKEVKDTFTMEDDSTSSSMSKYKDYFMDAAIEQVSDKIIDQSGQNLTQQLYEQMKRNYNIK